MIATVQQGLEAEGITVPMTKLCRWFEVPRRTMYYQPTKAQPKVQEQLEAPIRAIDLSGFLEPISSRNAGSGC